MNRVASYGCLQTQYNLPSVDLFLVFSVDFVTDGLFFLVGFLTTHDYLLISLH